MCVSHRLDTESHVLHSTPHGLPQSKCDKTGKKTSGDKHQTNCYVIIPLVKSNNTASCYFSYYLNSCLGYIYTIVNVLSFICPCLHSRVTHFSPCFTSVLFSSPIVINVMIHPVTKTCVDAGNMIMIRTFIVCLQEEVLSSQKSQITQCICN